MSTNRVGEHSPLLHENGNSNGCFDGLSLLISRIFRAIKGLCCFCCCTKDDAVADTMVYHAVSDRLPRGNGAMDSCPSLVVNIKTKSRMAPLCSRMAAPRLILPEVLQYRQAKETFSASDFSHDQILAGIHDNLKSLTEEEMINSNFKLYQKRTGGIHSAIIEQVDRDLPRQHVMINGKVFRGKAKDVEGLLKQACGISQDSGADENIDKVLTLIQQGIYGGMTNRLFSFPLQGREEFYKVCEASEIPPPLRNMNVNIDTAGDAVEIRMDKLFKFANEEGEVISFVTIGISFQVPKDGGPIRCKWDITPIDPAKQFVKWEAEFDQLRS